MTNPAEADPTPTPVDPRLLEILVCPVTHGRLEYDRERGELISRSAGLAYPIRDGAPSCCRKKRGPWTPTESDDALADGAAAG